MKHLNMCKRLNALKTALAIFELARLHLAPLEI